MNGWAWSGHRTLLLLGLLLTVGCTATVERDSGAAVAPQPPDAEAAPSAPRPDPAPTPDPGITPPPPGRQDGGQDSCEPDTAEGMRDTVASQLESFARSDIAGAYAMTSPFFRRQLALEAFETLIRADYPELIGNDGHRMGPCEARGRRGALIVGVRDGEREVVLRYDLSEEDDGWRIDGARRLPTSTLPPRPLA